MSMTRIEFQYGLCMFCAFTPLGVAVIVVVVKETVALVKVV
jgi:hypothetical protein